MRSQKHRLYHSKGDATISYIFGNTRRAGLRGVLPDGPDPVPESASHRDAGGGYTSVSGTAWFRQHNVAAFLKPQNHEPKTLNSKLLTHNSKFFALNSKFSILNSKL